ncbi:MAG: MATE family efflux transporter [Anaeroplasma bactoclasticum]|nr:MATE family efflux transporter [Anaeroplasma bactoclasticum]
MNNLKEKQFLFEKMSIPKAVCYLAIPTIISQLITIIYNWADTYFIGQLNDTYQMAAITVCHPAFMMTTAIANLLGIGGASAISRALGINNTERIQKIATVSLWGSIIVSIAYALLVFVFQSPLLSFLGATTNTYTFAKQYLFYVVILGTLPSVLNFTLSHLIRSIGMSKESSIGIAMGGIINMLLDPLFIFVFHLDVVGAAIATLLSNILATFYFILLLYKIRKKSPLRFHWHNLKIQERVTLEIIGSGLSSFLLSLMALLSNTVINKLMSNVDEAAISGVSIAKKVDLCIIAFAQGLSQGILPLIGYNYASNNTTRMKKTIYFSGITMLIFATLCVILFSIFPKSIVQLFIKDEKTIAYASQFLRILCISMPLTSLIFLGNTIFQATKQNIRALILILLRKGIIDIPLMLLLNHWIPVYGVIMAQPIVDSFAGILAILLYITFLKEKHYQPDLKINIH